MVKSTKRNKNKQPRVNKPKTAVKSIPRTMGNSQVLQSYLQMLADPCGSAMVHAPYNGTDSGYLIRTRCTFKATNTVTTTSTADYFLQWTPAGAAANGFIQQRNGDSTFSTYAQSDFLTSGVVAKARPLASCLKWVPTGPVTNRQGVVGMAYLTGQQVTATQSATGVSYADMLNGCNVLASNGSSPHEVKWLPTISDQSFTNPNVSIATEVSGGTVIIVLLGVDATNGIANGYFEATTIYEWTPAVDQGAAPSVRRPIPFTTQDAISQIRDVGSFLFGDSMAALGSAAKRAAGNMVTTMLTGATYMAGRRGGLLSL